MRAALWAEALKARRSRLPGVTVLAFTVLVAFGSLVMFIVQDPGRARSLGLLGAKGALAGGTADWPGFFALLAQAMAIGGFVIFGLVVVWCFGREAGQGTAKDLLALPTSRAAIVAAKFAVVAVWSLLLALYTFLLGLPVGALVGLAGWSLPGALGGLGTLLAAAASTLLLTTPLALAASAGRGYLPGFAALLVATFLAQVLALLGYGEFFPWSVPALATGLAGPGHAPPGVVGHLLVVLTGAGGAVATGVWWHRADHDR
ncbi:ABC-2 type transport system permease protein [Amycolatopsis pretoriensis]|uniref:ABC-2 type transport system permease protein n=1 Tax=Amycolatopsis pretoriensis TaxID=218821 RepID=A0A1H5RL06_9PSEU|nr:ABC transporter permease [Amycolatopsis pretoriensis]SEF38197.1 ABC-2 type transport system permease protein [Amycolatopsis pretoriensis]